MYVYYIITTTSCVLSPHRSRSDCHHRPTPPVAPPSDGAHPPPPLRPSRAVSPLIAAPPLSVVPGRRASSPSPATRVRREEEPQRVDPGAAASIPREKGQGAGPFA